eukprot:GHVU01093754.1.p1 GENE.GHVU01093754.1~~GHVU01093754.1.p1  ORF type:complete len:519 (+),score=55.89 GHVU01093754.1:1871-3427(+)
MNQLLLVIVALCVGGFFNAQGQTIDGTTDYDNFCNSNTGQGNTNRHLIDKIWEYQRTASSGPHVGKLRPVPVLNALSRMAYYHVLSHAYSAALQGDRCNPCNQNHCSAAVKFVNAAAATTEVALNQARSWDDINDRFDNTKIAGETLIFPTTASDSAVTIFWHHDDGIGLIGPCMMPVWTNERVDLAFESAVTLNEKPGNIGKANLRLDYNVMGVYMLGRLAVVYLAKLSSGELAKAMENQPLCSSSFVVPAFNMRCDPEGRYDLPGAALGSAPLPDPHAIESWKLASKVSDWMQTNNGQTSGALPLAETVSSVAYYRAIALAANDFCWSSSCAGKNPALQNIPTIASCSCIINGMGPKQPGTATCVASEVPGSCSSGFDKLGNLGPQATIKQTQTALNYSSSFNDMDCKEKKLLQEKKGSEPMTADQAMELFTAAIQDDDEFKKVEAKSFGVWIYDFAAVVVVCTDFKPYDVLCTSGGIPDLPQLNETTSSTATTPGPSKLFNFIPFLSAPLVARLI